VEAVEDHSVHPLGVVLHLHDTAVKSITEELYDNIRAREQAVDSDQPLTTPADDLLHLRSR
jgi:hypothetical protein